ncbi:cysteine desulfurase NifS [Clostridium tyrobutyricum]|jgi:cysteine desulfurase|uniref:Cysteine desulfurase IscS n=1 Tax=Clostridium tyrobutyricum DIVETGP TaxID=1408889 RepID=W6NFU2_CLOTY|nr:cysteine desulfurase NifS [Clostridium tyrobutyricum]AND84899.1 cysteine desulfurase [Clostridium tyrobutyricum]ANP69473.1 cysteine desulfurase NifS [Clostridium tyrobutyricum]MBV4416601.1 cysteine desulfurase NifS [Clostridium tyrobutyricum]MBV4422668.1 cysteine desulfurase NifS [Clostridium tyrobutyricum]MBV4423653.1 cysteine desulfurase NifS [Clostridium tyrobutyricum]
MEKQIYMDYSATTFVKPEVLKEMIPYFTEYFGNPSSIYNIARKNKAVISKARQKVADVINARKDEIFFTNGGSESDNWALKGAAFANRNKGRHIITTNIEHHAILNTAKYLEKQGFDVTYLNVDKDGFVNIDELKHAIREDTIIVSIMFANNEIGTIEPIQQIGKFLKEKNILFHTDAVQAITHVPIDVKEMNIDLLSMSSHKFYGPKGMGALYIKKGTKIDNLIHGGSQERDKRAGTENVPGIVGMSYAIELAARDMKIESERLMELRDKLIDGLLKIPESKLNGPRTNRLPGNVNVSFKGVDGEILLVVLDDIGIYASSGSACSAGSIEPSHVLTSIGLERDMANSALRLTLGAETTEDEVDFVIDKITESVKSLRETKSQE